MNPDISVIMPVFNSENYLAESINSILAQTFKNFELLIINDASSDSSKDIILSYSDSRIVFIDNIINNGAAFCRNIGIDNAKGKYLAFLDSDDIALPNRLELQYYYMKEHPDVGVCGSYAEYFGVKKGIWKYPVFDEEIKCRLFWGSSIIQSTVMMRKSVLIDHKISYNVYYPPTEDYKLWVDISQFSNFYNIPDVLVKYRTHAEQLTVTKNNQMDLNKTEIIIGQIKQLDILITKSDFHILFKFICYKYNFSPGELKRLVEIYTEFILKNQQLNRINQTLIKQQVRDRIFEACYFSTKKCGYKAFKIYRNKFGLGQLSFYQKVKFLIKALLNE